MTKKITIVQSDGDVVETTVSDEETAREYEELPFQVGHVVRVDVTDE
ncbi:hypothetical protein [Streptomyces sp. BH105]